MKRRILRASIFVAIAMVCLWLTHRTCYADALQPPPTQSTAEQYLQSMLTGGQFGLPHVTSLFAPLENYANAITAGLAGVADKLFIGLVTLEICVSLARSLIAGEDFVGMLGEVVSKLVVYNVSYWVFVRNGFIIAVIIVSSFANVGQTVMSDVYNAYSTAYDSGSNTVALPLLPKIPKADPPPTDPFALLARGFQVAAPNIAWATTFGLIPDEFLGSGATQAQSSTIQAALLGAFVTVGAYAFMAGTLCLAIAEAYIVLSVGIVMTGFLGSRWTQSMGVSYFSYAFSVGVKLMMVYVVIALSDPISPIIQMYAAIPIAGGVLSSAVALIFAMLAWGAPNFAASLLTGSSRISFANFLTSVGKAAAGASYIPKVPFTAGAGFNPEPIRRAADALSGMAFGKLIGPSTAQLTARRAAAGLPAPGDGGDGDGGAVEIWGEARTLALARMDMTNQMKFAGVKVVAGMGDYENSDAAVTNPGGVGIRL